MRTLCLALSLGLFFGCSGGGEDDDLSGVEREIAAQRDCRGLAEAFGLWTDDCGGGVSEGYELVTGAVGGSCSNVVDIRDRAEFTDQCLPWVEALDCADYESSNFSIDSSCREQLLTLD
jgi:hypothetical protein